jgi:RecB family endonuclease NucS
MKTRRQRRSIINRDPGGLTMEAAGSSQAAVGKIRRLPLREVWKHEALDFTTWLQENLDVLNDSLDISLSSAEREQKAGDFSVDLVAEDEDGNPVVIENQLERSNHDHLGKLLTYLVAIGAKTGVWLVSEPRSEHVRAISWLNESYSASFYLLKVEAIRPSAPATFSPTPTTSTTRGTRSKR